MPSLTDFGAQVSHINVMREQNGLASLDPKAARLSLIRRWNALLQEEQSRLQILAQRDLERDLANNAMTHLIVARAVASAFRIEVNCMISRP